jgi:hypothetical protein
MFYRYKHNGEEIYSDLVFIEYKIFKVDEGFKLFIIEFLHFSFGKVFFMYLLEKYQYKKYWVPIFLTQELVKFLKYLLVKSI